jgi:CRISPR-associated protein (TIGR02710 family)
MAELEELKKEWLRLYREDREAADKFYWEKLYPLTEQKLLTETTARMQRGAIPRYDCLILPIGLDASYYILLIKALRPLQVYFIATREGERYVLDKIIKETGLSQNQYQKDVVEYKDMDVADVYEKIKKRLSTFGEKIAVDLTFGKRVMVVGAGIVGAFFGCDLLYLDGEWMEEIKREEPGTERLVIVRNPFNIFGDLEQKYADELFNSNEFESAKEIYAELRGRVIDPREVELKEILANAYSFWDAFNYKGALKLLQTYFAKQNQYKLRLNIDVETLNKNITVLKYLENAQASGDKLLEVLKSEHAILHLLVDFYCNAHRRREQNRLEDALSRFYRLLELISQQSLAKLDFDTGTPDYNKFDPKIIEEYKNIVKQVYDLGFVTKLTERGLPKEVGLKDGHMLLFAMQDPVWKGKNVEDIKRFFNAIKIRDTSIVAHGVQVVGGRGFDTVNSIVEEFLERVCIMQGRVFKELVDYHVFPKFKR